MKPKKFVSTSTKIYTISSVVLVILAASFLYLAIEKKSEPLNENYHVSVEENHTNNVSFFGQTITVNVAPLLSISASDNVEYGLSLSSLGFPNSPLIITSLAAASPSYSYLLVFQDTNMTKNAIVIQGNDTSSNLLSANFGSVNYVAVRYLSGALTLSQSNSSAYTKGQFEYDADYSEQINASYIGPLVVSQYNLVLNDSYYNTSEILPSYYQLSFSGSSTGSGILVMNFTDYPYQYFSLIFDGNYVNSPVINHGSLMILGFETLTMDLISYHSIAEVPYDFVNNISIPYSTQAAPRVNIVSSGMKLMNSSGASENLSGEI